MSKGFFNDDQSTIDKVYNLYVDENKTVLEVSNILGCSTAVLQRFLKKHGIRKSSESVDATTENIQIIQNMLSEGNTYEQIANQLGCKKHQIGLLVRKYIKNSGKYSNSINENWIKDDNPLFWYFLGIFSSDGHYGDFNEVDLYQKDQKYLKDLQLLFNHTGKLYGDKKCGTLRLNSAILHHKLEELHFTSDKRYTAPFVKAPTNELQWYFIRGLFDGDGSLYFNYTSGVFENTNFQICTGSLDMVTGLQIFFKENNISYQTYERISEANNKYWQVSIRSSEGILKIKELMYNNNFKFCLRSKYNKFLKYKNLLEINKQVDDIVENSL